MFGEKRSRGNLAVGLGSVGFEHKIKHIYAGKKIFGKNLLKDAGVASSMGKEWLDESPHKEAELALLQDSQNMQLPGMVVRKAVKAGQTTGRS